MTEEIIKKLQAVVNRLLSYDPEILDQITSLSGKRILVDVDGVDVCITIGLTEAGIQLSLSEDLNADVIIKGRPLSLLSLLRKQDDKAVFPNDLELKGDINLAQRFQTIMKGLDIDWEELISEYVGDTVARKFTLFFNDTKNYFDQFSDSFKRSTSEYLRFETEMLPDELLVDEFINEVDVLRNDVELLKIRIERLINANS